MLTFDCTAGYHNTFQSHNLPPVGSLYCMTTKVREKYIILIYKKRECSPPDYGFYHHVKEGVIFEGGNIHGIICAFL